MPLFEVTLSDGTTQIMQAHNKKMLKEALQGVKLTRATEVGTCLDCGNPNPQANHNSYCEPCREIHRAKWKAEHTRQGPQDKRKGWLIGDLCTVKLKGQQYDAKILDMSDISRRENDYDLVQLELTKTVTGLGGTSHTQTWTHPEVVQTYKLKKRYVK